MPGSRPGMTARVADNGICRNRCQLNVYQEINMLRRVLLASAGAVALSGASFAADLWRPPPPPVYIPPAPPPLWTGFYVGVNAGGERSPTSTVNTTAFPCPCALELGATGCTNVPNFSASSALLATFSVSRSSGGFIGGGQLGYNYQFGPNWVAGFEADIQGLAGAHGNIRFFSSLANPNFPGFPILETATVSRRVDWLGTARGRLGWLATPTLLLYGTGGLAYGGGRATTDITQVVTNNPALPSPYFSSGTLNNTRVGWTAGGGGEWMLLPNWSLKVEYLYYD